MTVSERHADTATASTLPRATVAATAHELPGGGATPVDWRPAWARVESVVRETADVTTLALRAPHAAATPPAPGQFNMLTAFAVGEAAISVSGTGADGMLRHTIRAVGPVSRALAAARVGDLVGVRGPFGRGWPMRWRSAPEPRDLVIVAGGLGLAPLRPAILAAIEARPRLGRLTIVVGARSPNDFVHHEDLEDWRARGDLDLVVTVDKASPQWTRRVGFVTHAIPTLQHDPARTIALICGPEVMMRATALALLGTGVPPGSIFLSMERNMKCAVGLCGRCQFGKSFVCHDGPVFTWAEIGSRMTMREI